MSEKPLRVEKWGEGTHAVFGGQDVRERVTFDPTGAPDHAATLRLARDQTTTSIVITMTLLRSHDAVDFIFRRFSRLHPAAIVCASDLSAAALTVARGNAALFETGAGPSVY